MRKIITYILCFVSVLALLACKDKTSNVEQPETNDEPTSLTTGPYNLATNVQDGVILHAWNWSYKTIEANLENIAEAGFSTVQTSPVQQPKSFNPIATSVEQSWWKLYQPVSFSVGDAWLGDKDDLTSLCSKANEYGIKIIVDIVVNHMGNEQDFAGYAPEIKQYESTIFADTTQYFHPYQKNGSNFSTSDSNAESVTRGSLGGLPDLNTANSYIQDRVKSLLKECIDCGVSGFRFDAAKHIETPDDGDYASDFWPNIINDAQNYAKNQYKRNIYCYGEILNSPGMGRKITSYTPYMSVTDNVTGEAFASSFKNRTIDGVLANTKSYNKKIDASKLLLWAESHDTYISNINNPAAILSNAVLNRTWSVVANRLGATALYFARPGNAGMGECGSYNWMSQEVATINKFHNHFIGATESFTTYSYNSNDYIINTRYNAELNEGGVVITRVKGSSTEISKFPVANLSEGMYYDQISGNKFMVSKDANGQLVAEGACNESGIIVLYDAELDIRGKIPELSYNTKTTYFYDGGSTEITIKATNSDNVYYQINDGEKIKLPTNGLLKINQACTITVTAEGYVNAILKINVGIAEKRDGYWCIGGVDETITENQKILAWVWPNGGEGEWREVEFSNGFFYVQQGEDGTDYGLLLAYFELGVTIDDADWNLAPAQTIDLGKPLNDNMVYTAK